MLTLGDLLIRELVIDLPRNVDNDLNRSSTIPASLPGKDLDDHQSTSTLQTGHFLPSFFFLAWNSLHNFTSVFSFSSFALN